MSVERTVLSVLFLTVGMAMTGCSGETAEDEQPAATGLPNPAAVFCVENGGTYEIRRAANRLSRPGSASSRTVPRSTPGTSGRRRRRIRPN